MIDVAHVHKSYGDIRAVRDVSFAVPPGTVTGLLGPNGAGKTTIMKVLTGYHFPSEGRVTVAGVDVVSDPVEAKRRIGYLPENAPLYPELTVGEYLDFIAEARGFAGAGKRSRIEETLERTGLSGEVSRRIDEISKGYRQRVGLAQAIVHEPDVLILDEPTAGLDPNQIVEIRSVIAELGREKTVILSTHIMQEVEAVCGRVLIMNRGAIVAEGSTDDIAARLKGDDVYRVVLRTGAAPAAETIPGVRRTDTLSIEGDVVELLVTLPRAPHSSEVIFDWSVAQGHKVLLIERDRANLERIFRELTSDDEEGQ